MSSVLLPIGYYDFFINNSEIRKLITLEQIQVRLAEAIKLSGLKQSEIANRAGIRPQQISCYIHGTKMPALDTLANICKIIDADANYILCQE